MSEDETEPEDAKPRRKATKGIVGFATCIGCNKQFNHAGPYATANRAVHAAGWRVAKIEEKGWGIACPDCLESAAGLQVKAHERRID
jgi:hypothetical protein